MFRSLSKTDFSICSQGLSCVCVQLLICFSWKVSASTYDAVEVTALLLIRQNTDRKFHHGGWSVTSVVSSHVFSEFFRYWFPFARMKLLLTTIARSHYPDAFISSVKHEQICLNRCNRLSYRVTQKPSTKQYELLWPAVGRQERLCNLVPRVLRLFGQRGGARRDSGIMEFLIPENVGFRS